MNFRERTSSAWARMANIVQRYVLRHINSPLRWRVRGSLPQEVDDIEVFHNVGFHARPPAPGVLCNVECVAVNVNAVDHPVIIATRDADTMLAVVAKVGLEPDETLVYTSKSVIKIRADGTVEIRSVDGTARSLAFTDELEAVQARLDALEQNLLLHVHASTAAGNPTGPAVQPFVPPAAPPPLVPTTPANIAGTEKFKAQ